MPWQWPMVSVLRKVTIVRMRGGVGAMATVEGGGVGGAHTEVDEEKACTAGERWLRRVRICEFVWTTTEVVWSC